MSGTGTSPFGDGRLSSSTTVPSARRQPRSCSCSCRLTWSTPPAIARPMMNSRIPADAAFSGCSDIAGGLRDGHADGTADAGTAKPAVAVRVLRQVLLVVVLGVIELRRRQDLGGDRAEPGFRQGALVLVAAPLRGGALRLVVVIDARPVLGADVVPLPHALRGVVAFPERLEQRVVGDLLRVEHHEHGLVVPGHPRADFAIGRVRRDARRVPDGGRVNTRQLPELLLGAPETSETEHGCRGASGIRPGDRRIEDVMLRRQWHLLVTPGQGLRGRRHPEFLFKHHEPFSRTILTRLIIPTTRKNTFQKLFGYSPAIRPVTPLTRTGKI